MRLVRTEVLAQNGAALEKVGGAAYEPGIEHVDLEELVFHSMVAIEGSVKRGRLEIYAKKSSRKNSHALDQLNFEHMLGVGAALTQGYVDGLVQVHGHLQDAPLQGLKILLVIRNV